MFDLISSQFTDNDPKYLVTQLIRLWEKFLCYDFFFKFRSCFHIKYLTFE